MAERHEGLEDELTEKVGGIPVWGYAIVIAAVIIGVIWWRGRHATNAAGATGTAATAATPQAATVRVEGEGSESNALEALLANNTGTAFYGPGNWPPGVPTPKTNEQWAHLMIDHFIGAGEDPALVTDAFFRYLRREKLTTAEASIIDLALEISIPPQGYLPVLRGGKGKKGGGGGGKKKVRVPNVEGEPYREAAEKIADAHLRAHADTPEAGIVAYTMPPAGKSVEEGSTVQVHMASTGSSNGSGGGGGGWG